MNKPESESPSVLPRFVPIFIIGSMVLIAAVWIAAALRGDPSLTARLRVSEALNELGTVSAVQVNDETMENTQEIVAALRTLAGHAAHHSYPTARFAVTVTGTSGTLSLELARDSDIPTEFYVYDPKDPVNPNRYVGSLRTEAFDRR